ncbi:MAG: hypothetical protein KC493_16165 [Bacteriovoracaceae bacterium]|nr:hypothetical protein [Bacteriovoracaceae bacterium]
MKNIIKNKIRKLLGDSQGFSLVEIIMAIGVLSVGGYVILNTTQTVNKQEKVMTVTPVVSRLNLNMLTKVKRILTEIKDENDVHNQGICKYVSSTAASPGVGPVFIKLFSESGSDGFSNARWEQYVGDDWDSVGPQGSECEAKNNYQKCYKMKSDTNLGLSDKKSSDLNVVLSIKIMPLNMNPFIGDGKLFSDISGNTDIRDVKDVGFKVIAKVSFNIEKDRRISKIYDDFIWAPAVGSCDYTLSKGKKVKLSLSGAGASDPDGNTVYNRSGFAGNKQDPLRVIFRKTQVQKGKLTNNGQFLQSDTNENIFGSCNEVKYRCPQEDHSKREYDDISMTMNLTYFPDNKLVPFFASQMTMVPKLVMQKGESGTDLISSTASKSGYYFDELPYSYDSSKSEYFLSGAQKQPLVVDGSHILQVAISDNSSSGSSNSLCRRICTSDSNYNTSGTTYVDRYSPYLSYKFKGFDEDFKLASNQAFGCTSCYMKGCDRLGLETFGPMAKQPYQPLDSGIPECSMKEASSVVNDINPYKGSSKEGNGWSGDSKKCIAAKLSYDQSSLVYYAEDCSSSLPVMCFNYGKFLLARDISNGNESLSKVKFSDASARCFKMGLEKIPVAALDEYLGSTTLPMPKVNGRYEFINLAEQGLFISPQIQKDVKYYNEWRMQNGIGKDDKFWVNMEKDSGNNMAAGAPLMSAKSADKYGVYFDGNGVLIYRQYASDLGLRSISGDKGMILFHNIKFKGGVAVNPMNPMSGEDSRKFPFICRKNSAPYELYKSDSTSNKQSDGFSICNNSGGKFLPPTTSLGWVKAMFLVSGNHRNYPFPDPKMTSVSSAKGAWVGLLDKNDGKGFGLMNFDRLNSIGDTSIYTPRTEDKVKIVDGEGRYQNPRAMVVSGRIDNKNVDIPAKGRLKVNIENIYTINIELNDHETDVKKMTLDDIASKFNGETSKATMRVERTGGNDDDSRYKIIIESKSTDVDSMVEILDGNSNSVLSFSKGDKGTAPNPKKLCLDNSQYSFEKIPKKGYCKNEVTINSIKHGKIFGMLWELGGYSTQERFVFGN